MNIGWLYSGLLSLEQRTQTLRGNLTEPTFRSIFPSFFTNLTLIERQALKALGKYEYFIAVYDRLSAGTTFSQHEVNEIKAVLNKTVQLKNNLAANGLAKSQHNYNSTLSIIFPVHSNKSSAAAFKDEVDWFFDGIQKSLSMFEKLDNKEVIIINVQNEVLSIAVSIDWKMVLVIAWLIKEYKASKVTQKSDTSAISHLKGRGVSDKTISQVEEQLLNANNEAETNNLISKVKNLLNDIPSIQLADNWENTIRLLIKRIRDALSRGYKIETEIKNFEKLETGAEPEKLNEVKKIIQYDRNIDDEDITGDRIKIEQQKNSN